MVIGGRDWKGTPRPAGKMKFSIILIGVMLLRGIELHRHANRHGHKRRRADPQTEIEKDFNVEINEIDRLNQIDQSMNTQIPVEVTEENKEVRSNREDEIENEL